MTELTPMQHLANAERLAKERHWGPAEHHYMEALSGNDPSVAATAAFRLGRHAEHINDWPAAERLYVQAMRDGTDAIRTRAAFFLGTLQLVRGETEHGRDTLMIATESRDPLIQPWSLLRLGDACCRLRDYIGAYHAYTAAFATGTTQAQRWATAQLIEVRTHL